MSITGLPGQGPVRAGVPITDLTAGNLLAFGIMAALFERYRTGKGRWVTTSLIEAQVFMLDFQAARWLMRGEVAQQVGNDHPTGIPSGVFPTADTLISLAASSSRMWKRFCETIGRPDWLAKPEWADQDGRSTARAAINAAIADITRTKPSAYWTELFDAAGIPCGPIYSIDQVFADPQVQHLGIATPVEHPRLGTLSVLASPLNLSGVDKAIRSPTPDIGADTEAVLAEAGFTAEEIARMRAEGAI